jgi:SAM-dependent methyltransferase
MKKHPVFGLSATERGWVPAPSYLLRRARFLKLIAPLPRGSILEIGCGGGALLSDLSQLGFTCCALETSAAAFALATHMNQHSPLVKIYQQVQDDWQRSFDIVVALEVLEHIEDDQAALAQWATWLKPKGRIIISVPAHPQRWTTSDVWAGHFRRYERITLREKLEQEGFQVNHLECYGFPLANIIDPIRAYHHARLVRQYRGQVALPLQRSENTARSGVERSLENKLYPLQASWVGTKLMQLFFFLQEMFVDTDLGNGYLVLAQRR